MIGKYQLEVQKLERLQRIRDLTDKFETDLEIFTLVNSYNWWDDMNMELLEISPKRWSVFSTLLNPNAEEILIRDKPRPFFITEHQFVNFLKRHQHLSFLLRAENEIMDETYLGVDDSMRFLKKEGYRSQSILEVGVDEAIRND